MTTRDITQMTPGMYVVFKDYGLVRPKFKAMELSKVGEFVLHFAGTGYPRRISFHQAHSACTTKEEAKALCAALNDEGRR